MGGSLHHSREAFHHISNDVDNTYTFIQAWYTGREREREREKERRGEKGGGGAFYNLSM